MLTPPRLSSLQILDTNPLLFFHLQQQRLIELIRGGNVSQALQFASEELAPRGEEFPNLLPELEKTMALLAFDLPTNGSTAFEAPAHIAQLLSPAQKLRTAGELNAAILASQSQGCDPKLPQMLRIMGQGEELLGLDGPGKLQFPHLALLSAVDANAEPTSSTTGTGDKVERPDAIKVD